MATHTVTVSWTTSGARSVSVSYTNELGCTSAIPGNYNVTVNPLPAAQAGADGYIVKPFSAATLNQKIEAILKRKGIV